MSSDKAEWLDEFVPTYADLDAAGHGVSCFTRRNLQTPMQTFVIWLVKDD